MEVQFCINNIFETIGPNPSFESLSDYFKANYYNKIFVKKLDNDLVLIYNNFDSGDTETSDLYNECRSLVVKLGELPRVVSYTHDNIKYLKISEYQAQSNNSLDVCEESFEGTLISVFNYNGTWHLTTSRCGSIDSSYYYSKTRSFGTLFDECIRDLGLESRDEFLSKLDQTKCYYFVLVHHENKYVVDYTERFGPSYAKLAHVITRDGTTMRLIQSNLQIPGLVIPTKFSSYQDGLNWIMSSEPVEGLIIQRPNAETGKSYLMKIHTDKYWLAKSRNPNYPSRWFGYLDIFKRDDPTFRIPDYQTSKSIVENLEINGKQIDITGMIYLLYKGTAEALFDITTHFTRFDHANMRFEKINSLDYSVLQASKFGVLRKQLSALQGLVSKQKIRSGSDIISHLRKYVSVEDFIGLLGSIQVLLEDPTVKYIRKSSKTYKEFLDKYLENIRN